MSTETYKLGLKFITTDVSSIITNPSIHFSPQSKKLLSLVFNRIAFADELWKGDKKTFEIKQINNINIEMSHYPDEIQQSVIESIINYKFIEFNV
jgi:hypothetical protein